VRLRATVMGIPLSFHLPEHRGLAALDPDAARAAVADAIALLQDAERRFSRHVETSELSALRRGDLDPGDAGPELREVLALGAAAHRASAGAFDVVGPDGLPDTDGVVKGWAAQRAADLVVSRGVQDLCLNIGGDVAVRGGPEPGRPWAVAVRHPLEPEDVLAVVHVADGGVATSGTAERGAHLWDGRTGRPAGEFVSLTVVAADLSTADVLATAAFALGEPGPAWAVRQGAAWVLAVRPDGGVATATAQPAPR
jgi:thiamine biosynthesis lipoprotein